MTHQDFTALVGAWRLISFGITFSDTGERIEPYGANPDGHMVLSQSGRIMFLFGPRDRHLPQNDADSAALFNNLFAYTGIIRLDGAESFITTVDYAWNPLWFGEQLRHFTLTGDKLVIRTPEQTAPAYGPRVIVGDVVWERDPT
jgi:Lipocalin-like domain